MPPSPRPDDSDEILSPFRNGWLPSGGSFRITRRPEEIRAKALSSPATKIRSDRVGVEKKKKIKKKKGSSSLGAKEVEPLERERIPSTPRKNVRQIRPSPRFAPSHEFGTDVLFPGSADRDTAAAAEKYGTKGQSFPGSIAGFFRVSGLRDVTQDGTRASEDARDDRGTTGRDATSGTKRTQVGRKDGKGVNSGASCPSVGALTRGGPRGQRNPVGSFPARSPHVAPRGREGGARHLRGALRTGCGPTLRARLGARETKH